ncbi:MAG: hypothetical protein Q7U51_06265 [Methanoregula sp.]|nr:hypothetical protein [Methanoregula sp.]
MDEVKSASVRQRDYTKERHEWLPDNLDDVKGSLLERQKKWKLKKQKLNYRIQHEVRHL